MIIITQHWPDQHDTTRLRRYTTVECEVHQFTDGFRLGVDGLVIPQGGSIEIEYAG